MEKARFRAGSGRFFKVGSDTGGIGRIVTAVMGAQGLGALPGGSHEQLRGQQQVPVLVGRRVQFRGDNSSRPNDAGPPPKRVPRLSQQFPGPQHPSLSSHQPTKRPPRKGAVTPTTIPTEAGQQTSAVSTRFARIAI